MNKWETINTAFKKEMLPYQPKQAGEKWDPTKSYAGILAEGALQPSRICVLGINWGADPGVIDLSLNNGYVNSKAKQSDGYKPTTDFGNAQSF